MIRNIAGLFVAAFIAGMALCCPAKAQLQAGLPVTPLGFCQAPAGSLASAAGFSACVAASFTATCAGSVLTASAVTGDINAGWPLVGTGITAAPPTFVLSQLTGTPGGAGNYQLNQSCTSSGASLTAVGPPNGANVVLLQAEAQILRFRDDGGSPSTTVGMLMQISQQPFNYTGTMSNMKFISATAGGILDASFYKSSSP